MRLGIMASLLLALMPWERALAHPHVFIHWHVEPQIEKGAIAAIKLRWRFDDLYSDLVLSTVDRDRDRKLSQPEIEALAARTVANLEKVKFYATFTLDGAAWQAEKADHFTAAVEGDFVVYTFTLKLLAPAKTLSVWSLDSEYYIEMRADEKQPLSGTGFSCTAGPGQPVKTQMWGSLTPDTISCSAQ
ncbi:MAG: hypothetical protein K0S54_1598 [Alphaproteobacteria bacterium]|nr:hypothetical protein [Alphaproteobacteria bacterium]